MPIELRKLFYVELEPGVWLREGDGDPPRTLDVQFAHGWRSRVTAEKHLAAARQFRPFANAQILYL